MPEQLGPIPLEEPTRDAPMTINEVVAGLPFEGDVGQGLLFRTNRGNIEAIIHQAPDSQLGVIWVCGARGGFGGPAGGIYARLVERFVDLGITSLRLNYREPNVIPECVLDLLAGQLAPRPLLVVHGKSDTRLPYSCGVQIHASAKEPKKLVLYEGAEHRLEECRDELEGLLEQWIPATLSASITR